MIRTEAVTEIPLHFYPFHFRFLSRRGVRGSAGMIQPDLIRVRPVPGSRRRPEYVVADTLQLVCI
jgi:hypothetical protein